MSTSSTKQKAKQLAENLLLKIVDSLDSKKEDEVPPKPPPKPLYNSVNPNKLTNSPHNLLQSFAGLKVSSDGKPDINTAPSDDGFIGGFHPGYISTSQSGHPPLHHSTSAPPPAMPAPFGPSPQKHSLTMQMALRPDSEPLVSRPHSTPHFPPFSESDLNELRPMTTPTRPKPSPASTPHTPGKASTSSTSAPPTPSDKQGQVRCAGTTKAGKRCTRTVKAAPALSRMIGDNDDSDNPPLERFCFQHTKELLGPSGCYSRKNGEWVTFNDWIPGYLQIETQLSLRIEMERTRSQSDVDGYIYTFEIREDESTTIKLKVGRAVNLVKRIDQWGKQCGSKEQVLRGYYPGPEAQGEDGVESSLMKGRVKVGDRAPCCHRLERLIHLELADLASTCIYLEPEWPAVEINESSSLPRKNGKKANGPCVDCGSTHKEIFEFQRWEGGVNDKKEWDKLVKPVVERWGKFVELYV